jgi:hypothetical protein
MPSLVEKLLSLLFKFEFGSELKTIVRPFSRTIGAALSCHRLLGPGDKEINER